MAKLYIIATPIGNLGDITFRAIETLKEVDLVLCEDTRRTKKLLDHYKIEKPLLSYHQRSKLSKTDKIIEQLKEGKNLALVTDAGTPGISDPGNELLSANYEFSTSIQMDSNTGNAKMHAILDEVEVIPIPGASALTTLISVAGINMSKFVFLGFPPNKKGRQTFFQKVLESEWPVVYYESPHRLMKNLSLLQELIDEKSEKLDSKMVDESGIPWKLKPNKAEKNYNLNTNLNTNLNYNLTDENEIPSGHPLQKGKQIRLIVGRELTKIHEEVVRGSIGEILKYYEDNADKMKGEFVIIVNRNW